MVRQQRFQAKTRRQSGAKKSATVEIGAEQPERAKKLRMMLLNACCGNPFVSQMCRPVAFRSISRGLGRTRPAYWPLLRIRVTAQLCTRATVLVFGCERNEDMPYNRARISYELKRP
jgi:hypothetical protein